MKFYKDFDLKEVVEEVYFIEDLPDGKYYYNDYGKRCVSIKNGKKQGLEIFYGEKGTKIVEKYYNNGIRLYEIHFQRKKEKNIRTNQTIRKSIKRTKRECKRDTM